MFFRFNIFFLIASLITLYSCATGPDYQTLNRYMASNRCAEAARLISDQKRSYGLNARLLFLLDSGMIEMLCGRHESSNRFFHKAEELAEKLWTKSVTKEMASFIVNDYTRSYGGEDFEKALINLFSAINYMVLGQSDEALVEIRRLDSRLSVLNLKYENKSIYKEDAFGRYLGGIVYESSGAYDDAYIDYLRSYRIYGDYNRAYGTAPPVQLKDDLVRLAKKNRREGELPDSLKRRTKNRKEAFGKTGTVVGINFNGKSPVKVEETLDISSAGGSIALAFPRYIKTRPSCSDASLFVKPVSGDGRVMSGKFELAEDVNAIAVKNLEDRKARVIAKTIARAVVKQAVINGSTDDKMVKTLLNIASNAIERADTRGWRTLPGELAISRIDVRPGEYKISARACGGAKRQLGEVNIKGGETKFFIYNTMY